MRAGEQTYEDGGCTAYAVVCCAYRGADATGRVTLGIAVGRGASKDLALATHGVAPHVCAMSRGGDALVSNR